MIPQIGGILNQSPAPSRPYSTAGVFDTNGKLVRVLYSGYTDHPDVYDPVDLWDGTLEDQTVAPSGMYTIKVLQHNITYTWEGVIGNTSPDHTTMNYWHDACQVYDMEIAPDGRMWYTTQYNERWPVFGFSTTAYPQNMEYGVPAAYRNSYSTGLKTTTDGTVTYIAFWDQTLVLGTWLMGIDSATRTFHVFPGAESFWATNASIQREHSADEWIYDIAVQRGAGSFLVMARGGNRIITVNKATGLTAQSDAVTFTAPFLVTIDHVTNNPWIAHEVGGNKRITKCAIDAVGVVTTTATNIVIANPISMSISPDGTTLLVVDGDTHQIRAYNTSDGTVQAAWATNGVFGTSGGYATSPDVTNTKFMFTPRSSVTSTYGWVAFAPDGSFWIGDTGNYRHIHFSAGNSPAYVEHVMYMPLFYSCRVCRNDETRVFGDFLEFLVDYSKPLAIGNGSWTLTKNWGYGADLTVAGEHYNRLKYVSTYSNGRTYAGIRTLAGLEIYELTATGPRDTGIAVNTACYIDSDFNLWSTQSSVPGATYTISKNAFTGFDGANNPTWVADPLVLPATVVFTSEVLPAAFPSTGRYDNSSMNPVESTLHGIIPVHNPDSGVAPGARNDHLGGVDAVTGLVKFQTYHPAPLNNGGPHIDLLLFSHDPYFPAASEGVGNNGGGPILYEPGAPDIFTGYRGEGWGNNQTNIWYHWHDSGLMLGQFGVVAPYSNNPSLQYPDAFGDNIPRSYLSFAAMPEMAGNVAWGGLYKTDGTYYLYHNDEWYHGGIHRWRIEGTDRIRFAQFTVDWDATTYAPIIDPSNLLSGLPYDQSNLPDGTAGWRRYPATDLTTAFFPGPYWTVYTSGVTPDRRSPDIALAAKIDDTTCTLTRSIPICTGNWTLTMTSASLIGTEVSGDTGNMIYIDIYDVDDNFILRFGHKSLIPAGTATSYVNDIAIAPEFTHTQWMSYVGALRDLVIEADIDTGQMVVTYGDYSLTTTVRDAGADISSPAKFQVSCVGQRFSYFYITPQISITYLNFAGNDLTFPIYPDLYTDPDTFGTATLQIAIGPSLYTDTDTFGTADIRLFGIYPSVTTDTDTFGTLVMVYDQIITMATVTDTDTFGDAFIAEPPTILLDFEGDIYTG